MELLALAVSKSVLDLLVSDVTKVQENEDEEDINFYSNHTQMIISLGITNLMRNSHVRVFGFCKTIIPCFTEDVFHQHFRMTRATFEKLVTFCEAHLPETQENQLQTQDMLYITLWTVDTVTRIIEMNLNHFIKWPAENEIPAVSEEFKQRAGFPGVVGAMDGTYINICTPEENQKDYNNRNYTFAGFPGSAHDARVFRFSDLGGITYDNPNLLFPTDVEVSCTIFNLVTSSK
ncbi:putative nuclease HARBI1 isoform X1 [Daphnia sinensis]|uniref:Nuclease HARBI1 isoform X1 n=1 Tax=Daphnia sinensis TaxID=1820382 RepID=A0AAD5PYJ9_9CRUS|nr:putative nuclease HARBI1 isoform X1 [Daphnia sinensis]